MRLTALSSLSGILCLLILSGCNTLQNLLPDYALFNEDITAQGPNPVIQVNRLDKVDIIRFLDPTKPPEEYAVDEGTFEDGDAVAQAELSIAFRRFEQLTIGSAARQNRRNTLQGMIILASDQACGEYKNFLRQFEAEGNFVLGLATTVTGGLGAIFTGAATARACRCGRYHERCTS